MRMAWLVASGCHVVSMNASAPRALDVAPPFSLADQDGHATSLPASPTVLVFYRGYW